MRLFFSTLFSAALIHAATPNAPRWTFGLTNPAPGAVTVDASGNTYLAGSSTGNPFTATPGAYQSQNNGGTCYGGGGMGPPYPIPCRNAFVIKLDPSGNTIFATYFGGTANVDVAALAVDSQGNVYIGGPLGASPGSAPSAFPITSSAAFPLSSNQSATGNVAYLAKLNASGTQLQVPWEIAGQAATRLQVVYNGQTAGGATLPVTQAQPGVFYIENSDGSLNSPANPAYPGDFVAVYGTGGGLMNQPGVTGASWPLSPLSTLAQSVAVKVGRETASVPYAGSAPTLNSGFFQLNVTVPADLPTSTQTLTVAIGGITSAPVSIAIR